MPENPAPGAQARNLRMAGFALLAAYILFSPFLVQIADLKIPFIRPWIMFKEVGVGVLKGDFIFTSADGAEIRLTPLEVLGSSRYPVRAQTYRFPKLVMRDEDIARFASDFCSAHRADYRDLRFEGRVGAGPAWRRLTLSDICNIEAP